MDKTILTNFNFADSIGKFTGLVKLSERLDYDSKDGYLYCKDVVLGNIGEQFYLGRELGMRDSNAKIKVHRIEEEVFKDESLNSLVGKPVTLEHPIDMVDSKNVRKLNRGTILGTPKRDGDNIVCDLVIHDAELVDLVAPVGNDGIRRLNPDYSDLSLGYEAKLVPMNDEKTEYYQADIHYNHVAVVREGRQVNAQIRDSKGELEEVEENKKIEDEEVVVEDTKPETEKEETKEKEVETKDEAIEPKKEEEKKVVKDKKYFTDELLKASALPSGAIKDSMINELNEEYAKLFPVTMNDSADLGIKVTVTDNATKIKDNQIDFGKEEQETAIYYDMLSNPESKYHKNYEAHKDFYNAEIKKGKR